jgi:glyoxylase-like metal-dependent hydrolase (beta-lactamase superfamily II)
VDHHAGPHGQSPREPLTPPPSEKARQNRVRHAFDSPPPHGEPFQVAPGIFWLRTPLPFKLNHINLWLLEDGDGWTVIDAGIATEPVKEIWERTAETLFAGKPLKRLIVTHFHPDHMGLAGWLVERHGAQLWMPFAEWAFARIRARGDDPLALRQFTHFYHQAGFDEQLLALVEGRWLSYVKRVSPVPAAFHAIAEGDEIAIGGQTWKVIIGTGHAPEHASLYCPERGILLAGDQILARISPNISVGPFQPDADPLSDYLASLPRFRQVPDETLVLPSHELPFTGLHARLDALHHHHDARLEETLAACARPSTAVQVLRRLFDYALDDHQLFFAIGESLAHLHYLVGKGDVAKSQDANGVLLFSAVKS